MSQFSDIELEEKELKRKIENLEKIIEDPVTDSVEGSNKFPPYEKTHFKIKGADQKKLKLLEKYKTILENRNQRILSMKIYIEEFINNIPTSRLRRIFTYRYINQYSWNKISILIGNSTSEGIRKEHDRFLEKMKKNELCPICPEKS